MKIVYRYIALLNVLLAMLYAALDQPYRAFFYAPMALLVFLFSCELNPGGK